MEGDGWCLKRLLLTHGSLPVFHAPAQAATSHHHPTALPVIQEKDGPPKHLLLSRQIWQWGRRGGGGLFLPGQQHGHPGSLHASQAHLGALTTPFTALWLITKPGSHTCLTRKRPDDPGVIPEKGRSLLEGLSLRAGIPALLCPSWQQPLPTSFGLAVPR